MRANEILETLHNIKMRYDMTIDCSSEEKQDFVSEVAPILHGLTKVSTRKNNEYYLKIVKAIQSSAEKGFEINVGFDDFASLGKPELGLCLSFINQMINKGILLKTDVNLNTLSSQQGIRVIPEAENVAYPPLEGEQRNSFENELHFLIGSSNTQLQQQDPLGGQGDRLEYTVPDLTPLTWGSGAGGVLHSTLASMLFRMSKVDPKGFAELMSSILNPPIEVLENLQLIGLDTQLPVNHQRVPIKNLILGVHWENVFLFQAKIQETIGTVSPAFMEDLLTQLLNNVTFGQMMDSMLQVLPSNCPSLFAVYLVFSRLPKISVFMVRKYRILLQRALPNSYPVELSKRLYMGILGLDQKKHVVLIDGQQRVKHRDYERGIDGRDGVYQPAVINENDPFFQKTEAERLQEDAEQAGLFPVGQAKHHIYPVSRESLEKANLAYQENTQLYGDLTLEEEPQPFFDDE